MADDLNLLNKVFHKFDEDDNGYLSMKEFHSFLSVLARKTNEINISDRSTSDAIFCLLDENCDGTLSYEEFSKWWLKPSEIRQSFFKGSNNILLLKAHALYKNYSQGNRCITYMQFSELVNDMGTLKDFENIDLSGIMSFPSFCQWLGWFEI